jgi:hypothetical protein
MELTPGERALYSGLRIDAPGHTPPPDFAGYRARPLPGVWSTGPFLHNGSVRTLAELLKPGAARESAFYVGSTTFDPNAVDYVSSYAGGSRVELYDTAMVGNSARGHEYGVHFSAQDKQDPFSAQDKQDLLEFLKTL